MTVPPYFSLLVDLPSTGKPLRFDPRGTRASSERAGPALTVLTVVLAGLIGAGDWLTGADVMFTLLYLAPIGMAVWYVGATTGLGLAVLSALSSFALRSTEHRPGVSASVVVWNIAGELGVFLLFALLIDKLRQSLDRETQMARTDALTSLPNRRALDATLGCALAEARAVGEPLTVLYIDVDDFKEVNDAHGHAAGDALLVSISQSLRKAIRDEDFVARVGGDEFVVVIPAGDEDTARAVAERVFNALATLDTAASFSVGAVTLRGDRGGAVEVLATADQLMYAAKRSGKGRITYATVSGSTRR